MFVFMLEAAIKSCLKIMYNQGVNYVNYVDF